MKKLLRWLGFHVHEWGPWVEGAANVVIVSPGGVRHPCLQSIQKRACKTCGFIETRDIK